MNKGIMAGAMIAFLSSAASAGPILFVSDSTTDTSIASVLNGAGYSVNSHTNQYVSATGATTALLGDLSSYDTIYWSATGNGYGGSNSDSSMFSNLSNYVTGGGNIFVTGYDSISSPTDTSLMSFLGGATNIDTCGAPGVISSTSTSLTTGIEDIRGLTPGTTGNQTCDRDGIAGLNGNTVGLVSNGGFYQWTLQSLGLGEIAYVSNGNYIGSESSMWSDTNSVYNAALLNFASNSTATVPEPSSLLLFGLGLFGLARLRRS